jgi:DNA-binding transcriptional regulator YiaG
MEFIETPTFTRMVTSLLTDDEYQGMQNELVDHGAMNMEKILFDDLVQSLKEAKDISKGKAKASRHFELTQPDVKAVREQIGLSQSEFARLMRVSVKTLQNWEQHRRNPTGPAAALLKIVLTAPDVVLKSLHA